MKKSNLETGMLCQCKDYVYLLINNTLISISGDTWDDLDNYTDDLVSDYPELTINAVSNVLKQNDLLPKNWNAQTIKENLLWERPSIIETIEVGGIKYSKQEVEDKLKDLKPINK